MNIYKKIIFDNFDKDIWHELLCSEKPILVYGMGNGADKIIKAFEKYGIEYKDVFASDGFVRGHLYRGKRVISYSEAVERYGTDFDIVVSFGSKLPDVIERIFSLENYHRVYAPDVPVCDGELFTEEFFDLHECELYEARCLFGDKESVDIFDNIVRFKLTGKLEYLKSTAYDEDEVDAILDKYAIKSYMDLGAYNGDTIKKYTTLCPNITSVVALEPDSRNFKKLSSYCDTIDGISFSLYNCAAYSTDATLEFSSSGNRNSSASSKGSFEHKIISVEGRAPDSCCDKTDFIKYDVEGLEYEALLGSKSLISNHPPQLLVSMYHKSEDMYTLPILVKRLCPEYSLYLRRLPYIPAWDLNLYAIKKS